MMAKVLRAATSLLVALPTVGAVAATAATVCVNTAGTGACHTTLQAAVAAAAPGDLIKVAAGTYYENVTIPPGKDGLKIVGASRLTTILDPDTYTDLGVANTGNGLSIESSNVQVKNLTIRNGKNEGIFVTASGVLIQGVSISGAETTGILLLDTAPDARIIQSDIRNVNQGILSLGTGTVVKNTTIANCSSDAATLLGSGTQAIGNRVSNSGYGIGIFADKAIVRSNDVRYSVDYAIAAQGNDPIVEGNHVIGAKVGVLAKCTACALSSVAQNTVTDTISYGIFASSDAAGMTVQRNVLLRTGLGLSVNGTGVIVMSNRATQVGISLTSSCYEAFGASHSFGRNAAAGCTKAGFYVNGSQITLDSNVATATFENGFTVDGNNGANPAFADTLLTSNKTTLDAGQGFAVINGAANTVLSRNTASKSRVDFCDEGLGTIDSGNAFGTRSATCDILH